jgi:hypothetical protein
MIEELPRQYCEANDLPCTPQTIIHRAITLTSIA